MLQLEPCWATSASHPRSCRISGSVSAVQLPVILCPASSGPSIPIRLVSLIHPSSFPINPGIPPPKKIPTRIPPGSLNQRSSSELTQSPNPKHLESFLLVSSAMQLPASLASLASLASSGSLTVHVAWKLVNNVNYGNCSVRFSSINQLDGTEKGLAAVLRPSLPFDWDSRSDLTIDQSNH